MQHRPAPDAEPGPRPSLESLKEGIAFVRGTPILIAAMGLDFVATFFASASALLPIFAKDILKVGPEGFGLLSSFPAMGSLVTGVTLTLLPPIKRQGLTMLWAVVAYGIATVGFGLATNFWMAAFFLAGTGAADTVSTVIRQTIRQLVTPDRLRGRMVSINMIFFMGGPQLGEMEAGLLAGWIGAVGSVVSGGIACLLATAAIAAKSPFLRNYRLPETHPKEQEDR
jgi:predicted MFS family arabinose efflux permease